MATGAPATAISVKQDEEDKKSTSAGLIDSQVIKLQSNLNGNLGDVIKPLTHPNETPETVNYAEIVNRSENGTCLSKMI